jgi:hypothetical protein
MNVLINALFSFFSNYIAGSKILLDYFTSPAFFDYFFNGGGWMVFMKGVLKGIYEARYGVYF